MRIRSRMFLTDLSPRSRAGTCTRLRTARYTSSETVIPPGGALVHVEATKGDNGYYLISDGNTRAYRVRIRAPSFAALQCLVEVVPGHMVADIMAILGSIDFVMGECDR